MTASETDALVDDRPSHATARATHPRALTAAQRASVARLMTSVATLSREQRGPAIVPDCEGTLSDASLRYMPVAVPLLAVFLCACIAMIWTLV